LLAGLYLALRSTSDGSAPVFIEEPQVTTVVPSTVVPTPETEFEEPEQSEEPPPTRPGTSLPPLLTQDIPPDVESGTITTPVGEARWVHLSGDMKTLPAGDAIPWPSGFAIFEPPDIRRDSQFAPVEILNPARLWLSADGINWQIDESIPVPSDTESAKLSHNNGEYWLASSRPLRLWHSTNGELWDEYDLSGLEDPVPAGFDQAPVSLGPVVGGPEVALFSATFGGGFPYADYVTGYSRTQPCFERLLELEPGVFKITAPDLQKQCPAGPPVLRFEESETGLRVFDNSTGDELDGIVGADLTHIAGIAATQFYEQRLFVIRDGQVAPAEVPWAFRGAALFGADGWIYAYQRPRGKNAQVEMWRTDDARSWINLGPPAFLAEREAGIEVGFGSILGGRLVARSFSDNGMVETWETSDGVTWKAAPGGLPDAPPPYPGTNPLRLASGWFANDGSQGGLFDGDGWWMYLGDEWFSLSDLGIEASPGFGGGGVGSTSIGATTIFYTANRYLLGDRHMWIMSNEPD
jgi:hypothetical protein